MFEIVQAISPSVITCDTFFAPFCYRNMIHTKDIRNRESLRNTKNVLESLNITLSGENSAKKQKPASHHVGDHSQQNSFFFQYFKRSVFCFAPLGLATKIFCSQCTCLKEVRWCVTDGFLPQHLIAISFCCCCCYRSEMRLRLGFLRRRSTESSLSVRPSPEEAQKWSESFTSLMASKCKSI